MPQSWVDINVNNENMEGYLARPEGEGRSPAVIVIQEIWGVNSHIQFLTDRFPALGYVGLAPAMFHRDGPMTMGLHEEMETAVARMGRCTDVGIIADVQAAVDYLKAQSFVDSDRIGIVGFCFGGRVTYLAACTVSDLKASVVYYGGFIPVARGDGPSPLERTSGISAPMLGLFGEDDANPSPEEVASFAAELDKHNKTYEFHTYPGAGHGFNCNARASYRPESARDAWGKAMAFFDTHLKG
ncbi:MAG: hypothetical protein BZY81_00780 [SAR202 cluster bacterium Io17-Chloro-G4]|nr:MAG: hypothetical protein BZY81_00780 [SAR202 cluster bacterium Io17-Chloro-G4]